MPLYTARVGMARRTGQTQEGLCPWVVEEVLIDSIKAGSKKKAGRLIMEHAARHTGYRFPQPIDREQVPDPVMIKLVRLDKEGRPVDSKFSMEAGVTIKPLPTKEYKPEKKGSKHPASNVGFKSTYVPPKRWPLDDPMTDEFIKTVMEKTDAK